MKTMSVNLELTRNVLCQDQVIREVTLTEAFFIPRTELMEINNLIISEIPIGADIEVSKFFFNEIEIQEKVKQNEAYARMIEGIINDY